MYSKKDSKPAVIWWWRITCTGIICYEECATIIAVLWNLFLDYDIIIIYIPETESDIFTTAMIVALYIAHHNVTLGM